jgi:predicted dehydrogenase
MMLNAGKQVLLERPATMDAEHLICLQKLARQKDETIDFIWAYWRLSTD